jgi:hypothetical protein
MSESSARSRPRYTAGDLLGYLNQAPDRGWLSAAAAQSLSTAVEQVIGILSDPERRSLSALDLEAIIARYRSARTGSSAADTAEHIARFRLAVQLFEKRIFGAERYDTAIAVRPWVVVTLTNVPTDLTVAEAERLAAFVRALAPENDPNFTLRSDP